MSSSNSFNSINITDLQKKHYMLMKQSVAALNYISKTDFPFKTLIYSKFNSQNLFSSNIWLNIISKFIDIDLIKNIFPGSKEFINNELKENDILLIRVIKILTLSLILVIFLPCVLLMSINFFQLKSLTYLLTKLYINNINNNLIELYSRLKATMNMDIKEEFENKIWLTKSINDCKYYNPNFSSFNSKLFLGILSFLTAVLPVILKTLASNSWIKSYLIDVPIFRIISWQFIILLFLYLPTTIILMYLIQSFRAKTLILWYFNVYSLESEIYNILDYKNTNTEIENDYFGRSLIQLFFLITAIICFVPAILDLPYKIKIFLGVFSVLTIILVELSKNE